MRLGEKFSYAGADHVNTEYRTVLFGYKFDRTCRSEDLRFAVSSQVVSQLDDNVAALFGLLGGQSDRSNFRIRICDTWNPIIINWSRIKTGDFLGTIMEDPVLANVAATK